MATKTKEQNPSNYHVPNLIRALKIMELFTDHPEGLTTTQITSILKIPRNSVFRITATLLDHGYLIRDEETKIFQLSQKLLTMGYSAIGEETLVEKSLPVMRKLRDRFKETVPLGILHGDEGLVIEEVQGLHSFRYVLEPGRRFHLHTSAPGKALVAFLPDDEQRMLIDKIKFYRFNEHTISNKKTFSKELEKIQCDGFAIDQAEEIEGMHCVGAPIFNRQGYPIAAIWITGPSFRIKEKDFSHIGAKVKNAADRISKSFGYVATGSIKRSA
jgi:DNA-binding IclR family transcriptional regulator